MDQIHFYTKSLYEDQAMAKLHWTKLRYSQEHLYALYNASRSRGQVTQNGVVFFYLHGDSTQNRAVILFAEEGHTAPMLDIAEQQVMRIDPSIMEVSFMEYHNSYSNDNHSVSHFNVLSGSLN